MLIACVHIDRRSDREVVKNLYSVLVFDSRAVCELPDAILEIPADSVVVKPHTKAVNWPAVQETSGKKRYARIPIDGI